MPPDPRVAIVVATIAATTALIGALIAAITASVRQKTELTHDRHLADVSELRGVLDAAAQNIAAARQVIYQAEQRLAEGKPPGDVIMESLRVSRDRLDDSAQRIRLRVGTGEVYSAFNNILVAFKSISERADDPAQVVAGQIESSGLDTAVAGFFEKAHKIVGSELKGAGSSPLMPRSGRLRLPRLRRST
jgi:hypothetical protein